MINKMIMPIGNAAIIDTDCKLYIDSSLKSSAIGSKINTIAQNVLTFLSGSTSDLIFYKNIPILPS